MSARINFDEFLRKIANAIRAAHSPNLKSKIGFSIKVDEVYLSLHHATPMGLIVNELLTNSFKHAFPEKGGTITISARHMDGEELEVIVADDGIGFVSDVDRRNENSLGMGLVKDLVERQLKGTIQVMTGPGTKFIIRFRAALPKEN